MAEADELITWLGFKFKPDAKKNIEQAKKSIDMIKNGVQKIGAFFLGASGAIGYFTNNVMSSAQEMSDLSKKMGVSTDALQQWKYVAEASGQSFEGLIGDLEQFRKVGIDAVSLSGKLAGMNSKIALQYKDRLGLSDDMFNVLRKGPAEIKKLMSEAYVIPKESIEQTATFNKQLSATKNTLRAMKDEIFMAVSPTLVDMTQKFKDWMLVNKEWIKSKLVKVIEGVSLGFRRFVDIAKKSVGYLVDIAKQFGLIKDDSPEVESVAKVITGALLMWSGAKILSGLNTVFTLIKGIVGLMTADVAVGATLSGWAAGFSALALSITELVVAWKTLKEVGGVLFDFIEKGAEKSLAEYEKTAKEKGTGTYKDLFNEDVGYGKMMALGYGELIGNSPIVDFIREMFGSGGIKEKINSLKNLIPSWMTRDYGKEFSTPFSNLKDGKINDIFNNSVMQVGKELDGSKIITVPMNGGTTTNNTNSGNTINIQMPYEQAVSFVRDTTGGEAMMTMSPGAFGGNFQ